MFNSGRVSYLSPMLASDSISGKDDIAEYSQTSLLEIGRFLTTIRLLAIPILSYSLHSRAPGHPDCVSTNFSCLRPVSWHGETDDENTQPYMLPGSAKIPIVAFFGLSLSLSQRFHYCMFRDNQEMLKHIDQSRFWTVMSAAWWHYLLHTRPPIPQTPGCIMQCGWALEAQRSCLGVRKVRCHVVILIPRRAHHFQCTVSSTAHHSNIWTFWRSSG
ncbi:hypothetical protein B0T22DRAFT_158768 [Podospora appendiculata]|uniref:Uncharacterized protein n=1 Tax=Podospora appendiculata TaxID=314037 RepID=A0AAE1CCK2_9PEZI|nr:hypothetical protein B0T22DRAFT_158768 [Podospora appendiculata]